VENNNSLVKTNEKAWLLYKSKAKVSVTAKITRRILRQQPDWGYAATIGSEMQHTVCKLLMK